MRRAVMKAVVAVAVVCAGCADPGPPSLVSAHVSATSSASATPRERHRWVEVPLSVEVDREVSRHADAARALGLDPLVHVRTPWNSAIFLHKHREDPRVLAALEGVYFIEILIDDAWLEDGDTRSRHWTNALLCGTYANSFQRVTSEGTPGRPSASPGKSGPSTPEKIAEMLRMMREVVASGSTERCVHLPFES